MKKKIFKAINILREICYILPPFPMKELSFVNEAVIEIDQNVSIIDYDISGVQKNQESFSFNRTKINMTEDGGESFRSMGKLSLL